MRGISMGLRTLAGGGGGGLTDEGLTHSSKRMRLTGFRMLAASRLLP
jgi:hypothetical protein